MKHQSTALNWAGQTFATLLVVGCLLAIYVATTTTGEQDMADQITDNGGGVYELAALGDVYTIEIDGCGDASGSGGGGGENANCTDMPTTDIAISAISGTGDFAGLDIGAMLSGTYVAGPPKTWITGDNDGMECNWHARLQCDSDAVVPYGWTQSITEVAATTEVLSQTATTMEVKYTYTDDGGGGCFGTITITWDWT